jgi:hypothetical protein
MQPLPAERSFLCVTSCPFFYFHSLLFAFIRFCAACDINGHELVAAGSLCDTYGCKSGHDEATLIDADERKIRPPADRREGPFGLYGFCASHTRYLFKLCGAQPRGVLHVANGLSRHTKRFDFEKPD